MLLSALGLLLLAAAQAQQSAIERLREIAVHEDPLVLAAAVRQHPEDARELVRRLIITAGFSAEPQADSVLGVARRLGASYAAVWSDSFPAAQVSRFSGMTVGARIAKIRADSARWTGNAALGRLGVDSAMPLWRTSLRLARELNDTVSIAAALGNLGAGFYMRGELDSAAAYLERSRTLAQAVGDGRTALNALGTLGSVARDGGDRAKAQRLYSLTLALRTAIGDARGASADHNNLGLLSEELGDLADARTHYNEALHLARTHQLDESAATALVNLANVAALEAEYAEALARYREALAIYRSLGSEHDAALVLHNLGLLSLRRGDYAGAKLRLREALAIYERSGTASDLVQARRDLAFVATAMGDLNGALLELRRADQELGATMDDPQLGGDIALARADVALQLNTYGEAERQYARAEALYRRAGSAARQAEAQQGRALVLLQRRQFTRAVALLESAMRASAAAEDRRSGAFVNLTLAYARQRQGDIRGARRDLRLALDTLRAIGDVGGEVAALAALGNLELDVGAILASEAAYREGLARLQGRTAAPLAWQLHAGLGRALQARGALREAAVALGAAIAEIERVAATLSAEERRSTYRADKWEVYTQLALIEHARGDAMAAFAANERLRSRQMLDMLSRGRVAVSGGVDPARAEAEQDVRRRIAELNSRLDSEDNAATPLRGRDVATHASAVTREALSRAQEQYAQLLLERREEGTLYTPVLRGQTASSGDVARRLQAGEAMLQYLVGDSASLAFVITRDTLRIIDLNVGRDALVSLVDFARGTIAPPAAGGPAGTSAAWRPPLRRLYQHLIAPLEADGVLAGVTRLIVVPHAELHYLPFAALIRRGERDEYLIERYELSYAPSASIWLRLGERTVARGAGVLAVAPMTTKLPGSRREVDAIRQLYGERATVLTGDRASEAAFRQSASQYDVVHLATLGVLNKHNPLFSFVQLSAEGDSDGRLEVHEVFGLTLRARLLVLSACQTALASGAVSDVPAGDDWVGLVQAFLTVGAHNVIATLWPVEDRATALLMTELHSELRSGASESAALARAQLRALRTPATAAPFYWAGFVLSGGR